MEEELLSTGTVQVHIRLPTDASCFLSECQHHIILQHQPSLLSSQHEGIWSQSICYDRRSSSGPNPCMLLRWHLFLHTGNCMSASVSKAHGRRNALAVAMTTAGALEAVTTTA